MTDPKLPPEVPTIEDDFTDIIEWTEEEEEAFLGILSKNKDEDL